MHPGLAVVVFVSFVIGTVAIPCSTSVQYNVQLDCEWTSQRHPVDYPAATAHFSPLCGTVHNDDYTLWTLGDTATLGVKDVAELGDCIKLESEIEACVGAGDCASGGYLKWMCQPTGGKTTVCTFSGTSTVTAAHSRISMMTMLAPSPDWNVGLDAIELCGSGQWVQRYPATGTVKLLPFDAGTDAGTTFASPNAALSSHQPMTMFTAADSSNIFYNSIDGKLYPICEASIVLAA